MRIVILFLIAITTFSSCGSILKTTPNEDKGIKEVLELYGGECTYSIGSSVSTEKGKKKYFELELTKSSSIDELLEIAEMPSSNIAYTFFKNLKAEREKYDEIHVVLDNGNGKSFESNFSKHDLEIAEKKIKVMNSIAEQIKAKNFEAIKQSLKENPLIELRRIKSKSDLVDSLIKAELSFPSIKSFEPFGFQFRKTTDGRNILHLSGLFLRENLNTQFSVDIDAAPENDEVLYVDYKF